MGRDISSIRIRRLLKLAAYLRKHGQDGAEVTDILTHCEYTNRRALQDDIRLLRDEYKADITYKRSNPPRYCMTYEGEFLLSLSLNIDDITALSLGLGMAEHFIPRVQDHCKKLWAKIAQTIPEVLLEFGQWLANTVLMEYPVSGIQPLVFDTVLEAMHDKSALKIDYVSPYKDRKAKTHIISPYDMFFKAHSWYMTAYCDDKVCMFKLSRIKRIEILDEHEFTPPPEGYDAASFRDSAWYVKSGELKHSIVLHIREPMASIAGEMKRTLAQRIYPLDDETVEFQATVPDLDEVARWVLSCSPYVKVIKPQELREKVCELANQTIQAQQET